MPSGYALSNLAGAQGAMTWNYDYYADGNIYHAYDVANNLFDRAYAFDHAARLTESYSGSEARDGTTPDGPYRETMSYDVWNNQLGRTGRWWQMNLPGAGVYSYANNRRAGLPYDASGRVAADNLGSHVFDARGARILVTAGTVGGGQSGSLLQPAEEYASTFDGNGQLTKLAATTRTESLVGTGPQTYISEEGATTYYLRSSVLGNYVIDEINPQGNKSKGYVYAGGERLAQHVTTSSFNTITWQHKNPNTGSWIEATMDRLPVRTEVDSMGRDVGTAAPQVINLPEPPPTRSPMYLENVGGQTSEAELGMQLYEDFYINKNYGGGHGPNQGGFWEQWYQHAMEREFQLMTGARFLFGFDRMEADRFGDQYQLVEDIEHLDVPNGEDDKGNPIVNVVIRDRSYYRLVPGSGSPQKNSASSSSQPGARRPYVDQKVLSDCVDMLFGVTMISFSETERGGRAGSFKGMGVDVIKHGGAWAPITVHNDAARYSAAALKKWSGSKKNVTGMTEPEYPWINYTGNDVTSMMEVLKTQIHELGHSLDVITGMRYKDKTDDGKTGFRLEQIQGKPIEAGFKLEGCVARFNGFKYK